MDFSKFKNLTIGGIDLKQLFVGGIQVWKAVSYTNQIPISTDASGNVYNGKGYKDNTYVTGTGADDTKPNYDSTGYIPCKVGDVIRLKDCNFVKGDLNCVMNFFSAKGTNRIGQVQAHSTWFTESEFKGVLDSNNHYVQFTIKSISGITAGMNYIRVTTAGLTSASVITINEEIE